MGENSEIQWTHHTFNPWTRCTKVSPACDHCYAETWANRATHPKDAAGKALPLWGAEAPRTPTSAHNWKQPIRWNREAEAAGERRRVFCASLADVFEAHPEIDASGARERLWDLIAATPWLDWLLLSKRWGMVEIDAMIPVSWRSGWPANVWAGATVENQEQAEKRIPYLVKAPARVHFLSCEPLIESVNLSFGVQSPHPVAVYGEREPAIAEIDWVIIGGESGHKARPFDLAWARSLVAQCRAAGVAPFVKQLGADPEENGGNWRRNGEIVRLRDSHGGDPSEWPEDLRVREFPAARLQRRPGDGCATAEARP